MPAGKTAPLEMHCRTGHRVPRQLRLAGSKPPAPVVVSRRAGQQASGEAALASTHTGAY